MKSSSGGRHKNNVTKRAPLALQSAPKTGGIDDDDGLARDLETIVRAWPKLAPSARGAILRVVQDSAE